MISRGEAENICQNDVRFKVDLNLYNGITISCIPSRFDHNTDTLHVTEFFLGGQRNIEVRRDIINGYSQILPNNQRIFNVEDVSPTFQGEFAKKLIIIGAGASHGYSSNLEGIRKDFCPPLANGIFQNSFDQLLDNFNGAKNLATSAYGLNDIEDFFQSLWNRVANAQRKELSLVYSLISTQYYLSSLFLNISKKQRGNKYNYYQQLVQVVDEYLAGSKGNEKVLIVNFNYDLLLEEALSSYQGYTYTDISDYADYKNRQILLFKPHGSCNWFREIDRLGLSHSHNEGDLQDVLVKTSKKLWTDKKNLGELHEMLLDELIITDGPPVETAYHRNYFPQLLIPFKDKDDFSMPDMHLNILTYLLSKVEDVLVVGWKGSEAKFNKLLQEQLSHKALNFYYANYTDNSIKDIYSELLPKAQIRNIGDFFIDKDASKWHNAKADFGNLMRYLKTEENFFFK